MPQPFQPARFGTGEPASAHAFAFAGPELGMDPAARKFAMASRSDAERAAPCTFIAPVSRDATIDCLGKRASASGDGVRFAPPTALWQTAQFFWNSAAPSSVAANAHKHSRKTTGKRGMWNYYATATRASGPAHPRE